jgi:hypothetical protein
MTHCPIPAQHKGHCYQGQGKEKAVPRTQKRLLFRKRRWAKPEGISGIRDRDLKKELHLRKKRTSSRIFKKTVELEVTKQIVGTSIRLQNMSVRTLWRGRPPLKQKNRLHTE